MSKKDTHSESLRSKLHQLKSVQLSEQERSAMKSQLLSYADMHEAPARRASVLSPFSYKSFQYSSRVVFSGALALLLLVGSTGVSFAAENTLPGQPLYAVKVNVAEPVESAIISVTSGKAGEAEWQNTLAERRLQEAATLADDNDLASSTQVYLAQQVAIHIDASQEDSADLAEAGATTTATEARTDLASRLSAHKQVLALLANRLQAIGTASTTAQIAILFQELQHNQSTVTITASSTEIAIASSTDSEITLSTSTPMLAINTDAESETNIEEAHTLHQELRLLNFPAATTTSTSTASSSEEMGSTTDSTATSTTKAIPMRPYRKLLELLQN